MAKQAAEDPLVAKAFDVEHQAEVEAAIGNLDKHEAQFFLDKLQRAIRKRKLMITGYLVAMVVWIVLMIFALAIFGMSTGFVGYVFLAPFAGVGLVLYIFGKWADRIGGDPSPPPASPAL